MKCKVSFLYMSLVFAMFFGGCAKDIEEYNKPAIYWYGKIVKNISNSDLERADDYYSSLAGEHIGSPLLPEATMILAVAHINFGEYILAEYFLDEYIKRYATADEKEIAEFLKIKAKYLSVPHPGRDQALIDKTLNEATSFIRNYPNSIYAGMVDSMRTRLFIAQAIFSQNISLLYDRVDKPKSASYYKTKDPQPWIVWSDIQKIDAGWYRAWFEGDGGDSWYAPIIPETRSVVSRNSVLDDLDDSKTKKEVTK